MVQISLKNVSKGPINGKYPCMLSLRWQSSPFPWALPLAHLYHIRDCLHIISSNATVMHQRTVSWFFRRPGDMSLSESMTACFTDAYMRHSQILCPIIMIMLFHPHHHAISPSGDIWWGCNNTIITTTYNIRLHLTLLGKHSQFTFPSE